LKAYEWYEQEQKGLGERLEKTIEQRLQQLVRNPEHYSISKLLTEKHQKLFFHIPSKKRN
jgi:hypothetical protein